MALVAENVRIGTTGNLYIAPLGTAAPTDVKTPLPAAWKDLGYFSADGVTESWSDSTSNIVAWQNAVVVRTVVTESVGTLALQMIETNVRTLEAFYKGSKVTAGEAGEFKLDVIPIKAGASAFVLDWFDGDIATRIFVANGEVTARGDITYVNGSAVGYPITISTYPSAAIGGALMRKFSNDKAWNPTPPPPPQAPAVTPAPAENQGATTTEPTPAGGK